MYQGTYTLIGQEMSMFTRKLEAQLRYQNIPYQWEIKSQQNTDGIIAKDSNFDEKNPNHLLTGTGSSFDGKIVTVATEAELFENLIRTVGVYCPDILIGYEIQRSSWGYLCRRAANLNINLTSELSRMPKSAQSRFAGPNG